MAKKNRRNKLFSYLDGTLSRAEKKTTNIHTRNVQKIKWERIIIGAVAAYGKLLETEELESMKEDITKIKKELKIE